MRHIVAIAFAIGLALPGIARSQGTLPAGPDHQTMLAQAAATRTPAPPDAYCYIGWPRDGQVIKNHRFKVWFGLRNFGVAPAGVEKPNTGHHHLLVNAPLPPLDQAIPNDKSHLHFGLGQTETFLDLPNGTYTLQLLMGDANHVPHDPPVMSKKITIRVEAGP
jgi:Domain of unknown function (DUF4399)